MNLKSLKVALLGLAVVVSGYVNAGLITLNISGTDLNNVNNYYQAEITFDDTVAGESGGNTVNGIVDFNMQTFGVVETSFDFGDIQGFYWNYLYSNDLAATGTYVGEAGRAWFAIAVANDEGYYMTNTDYIWQDLFKDNTTLVTYVNDPVFSRPDLNAVNVPEPSTLAVFGLAMLGLGARRFRKQA